MSVTFIVLKGNKERCSIMHDADVYLRKNNGKWSIMIESTLNLEIVRMARRDLAIAEFERITNEITNGVQTITIEEKVPF
jgi:hypothetical protein